MRLTSLPFYIFAAVVMLLYYVLPHRFQWIVLTLASVIFYATYGVEQFAFLGFAALIAYFAARWIQAIYDAASDASPVARKTEARGLAVWLSAALVLLLIYAKAGHTIVQGIARMFFGREEITFPVISLLGISYYTFSLISYIADVYWKRDKAETNFLRLFLFAIYFPKILQGPIARHKDLAPQLAEEHTFRYREFCFGLQLMLWGYFKKIVIADRLALFVNTVFGNTAEESGAHLLVAAVFGAFQLYCDFSGCMDIIGGFSQILGLRLEANFNHPFFSRSAAEFWRRWHITLGTWFKDYVYMPLAISPRVIGMSKAVRERFGTRAGRAVMTLIPSSVVWLLTGIWHNFSLNYLVWGIYWGTLIICSTIFTPEIKKLTQMLHINTKTGSWKLFQMVRTFLLFVISRIFTIPHNLQSSMQAFEAIITRFCPENFFDGSLYTLGLDRPNFILAVVCILILWAVSMLQERGSVRERIAGRNIVFRWAIYYAAFFVIVVFGIYGPGYDPASFVYMQF